MSCCTSDLARDCVSQSDATRAFQRVEEIRRAGRSLGDGRVQYVLSVPAVHCAQCIFTLEERLLNTPDVQAARVNLTLKRVSFTLAHSEADPAPAVNAIAALGYDAYTLDEELEKGRDHETGRLIRALAVAGFAAGNIMLLSVSVWTGADGATRNLFHLISALIAIPAVAYAGQPFFQSAWCALKSGRTNMDVPISIGVILTLAISLFESLHNGEHAYFDAAVTLLFFLLIGRTLDNIMRARARDGVARLARLAAKGGLSIQPDGTLAYIPLDEIKTGMLLRIAAGERIPVDAQVVTGRSEVDRALVTGESKPVLATVGTKLESGVLNLSGPLDVQALNSADKSFIADVMKMMEAAEHGRGIYVRIADRMARLYAPVVHLLALLSFLGWMFFTQGNWHQSIMVAVSVLIVTCPCALGLAVPVAHVISAIQLFRHGILLKDGSALERLAEIDHLVFDKTGTLTTGTPQVTQCDIPAGDARGLAKALSLNSSHPAAQALSRYIVETPMPEVAHIVEIPGQGVEGLWQDKLVRLGRPDWVAEIAAPRGGGQHGRLAFAVAGQPSFPSLMHESLRTKGSETVAYFRARGIVTEILSGDSQAAVAAIAQKTTIPQFQAELRPADKLAHIAGLKQQGTKTFMVGDGVNDAPALMGAHVSMAPASASDVGRMASDYVFTRDSLAAVAQAHDVARNTARIVKQNFGLAIIYNVFAVPLAMAGLVSPLVAAIAMSSSSIIVVANSLKLYIKPKTSGLTALADKPASSITENVSTLQRIAA